MSLHLYGTEVFNFYDFAFDYCMQHTVAMATTRIASCTDQPTTSLRQTCARVNVPKSCRRPVVSLSDERKSYRVNRP